MNRRHSASALLASILAAVAPRAFGSDWYVWDVTSTTGQKSWDLTSNNWIDDDGVDQLITWPADPDDSMEASFYDTITVNQESVSIPTGTIVVNGPISVYEIGFGGSGWALANGSGSLTLIASGSNVPQIATNAPLIVSVPIQGTNGAGFSSSNNATISLSGVSTYTGPTTIGAFLNIAANNALPDNDVTNYSTLALNNYNESFANVTNNGTISSTGGILTAASLINNGDLFTQPSAAGAYDGDTTIGDLSGSGPITLQGTFLTAGVNAGNIDTFSGILDGNGSFFKTGSSELILLGDSFLTGARSAPAYTVEDGTLAGNTSSLVNSIDVFSGATLLFAQSNNGIFSGVLSGAGTVAADALSPNTLLTFSSNNTFTGNLRSGLNIILAVSSDAQLGTVATTTTNPGEKPITTYTYATFTFDGGTLRSTAPLTSARPITVTANGGTFDSDNAASTFSGPFSSTGNGTLTLTGGGTVTLANNTATLNALAVNAATLALANNTLALAATLSLSNASVTMNTSSAAIAGNVALAGNTTLTLTTSSLQSGSVAIATNTGDVASASLALNSSWTIAGDLTIGKNSINLNPLILPPGIGTLTLPIFSSVSVSGTTTLAANSTLSVSQNFTTGALTNPAGSSPSIAINDFSLAGPALTLGSDTAPNATYSGAITDNGNHGSLHKIGANTQTLSGNDTYTGSTQIDGGTLVIASATALPAASLITNNANLTFSANASINILSGNGTLALADNVHLTLAGAAGSEQAGLSLATASLLDIGHHAFILEATSTNKPLLLSQAMNLVASPASSGTGIISSAVAANPGLYAIAVVDNAALATPFATYNGQPTDQNSILIAPALIGDTDLSGTVDLNDLNTVLNHLGQSTLAWTDGNFDHAPTIDLNDLNDVLNHLGLTSADSSFSIQNSIFSIPPTPTPEPASLAALALAPLFLLRKRSPR